MQTMYKIELPSLLQCLVSTAHAVHKSMKRGSPLLRTVCAACRSLAEQLWAPEPAAVCWLCPVGHATMCNFPSLWQSLLLSPVCAVQAMHENPELLSLLLRHGREGNGSEAATGSGEDEDEGSSSGRPQEISCRVN